MSVLDEAVYLLNNEKYLHLRENTSGVGYATYDKLTLLPLEKGQIPFEHLPPRWQKCYSCRPELVPF